METYNRDDFLFKTLLEILCGVNFEGELKEDKLAMEVSRYIL
jgi:hypothetical protein